MTNWLSCKDGQVLDLQGQNLKIKLRNLTGQGLICLKNDQMLTQQKVKHI